MHRGLIGLLVWLGLLGSIWGAETPALRFLTGADAQQAQQWQKQIDEQWAKDQLDEALPLAQKLHDLRKQRQGADNWQTWDAHFQAEEIRRLRQRPATERQQLQRARQLNSVAFRHYQSGQYAEAANLYRQTLAICEKALPAEHPHLLLCLSNLAVNLHYQGKYAEAEKLLRQALALREKALPAGHPDIALSFINLADTLKDEGKYAEAEQFFRQALALREKALPAGHPDIALSLTYLAGILQDQGKFTEAEKRYRQALAICEKELPAEHPHRALSLNNLAFILKDQGKYAEAETLYRQALALRQKALPAGHPAIALSLHNLAFLLRVQGKCAEAESLSRQALALREKALPAGHPDIAHSLNNLASILQAQGKYAEAELLSRQALALREKALPAGYPTIAHSLNNLASILQAQGKYAEAELLCRQALAIYQKALPAGHPHLALSLSSLASNLQAQGKYAEAVPLLQQATQSFAVARLLAAPSGADRAQFAAARFPPEGALATLLARQQRPQEAWQAGEAQLARGLLDDLTAGAQSRLLPEQQNRLEALRQELERLAQQIQHAHRQPRLDDAQQRQLQQWVAQSRQASDELGAILASQSRQQVASLAEVQRRLPADAALVFWLDWYSRRQQRGEHWACVVRSQGAPIWVELPGSGTGQAWTPEDLSLPRRLWEALARPTSGDWPPLARQLYRQRLQPLEEHLQGVQRLVSVPAGWMAGIPLEALSQRWTISYTPSGTIHARQKHRVLQPALLAVGDPNFRTTPPPPSPDHGLFVQQVQPTGNAAQAGLKTGDVVLRYNGVRLQRFEDLRLVTEGKTLVPVQVWRNGELQDRTVRPGPLGVALARESAAEVVRKQREADAWLAQRGGDYTPLPGTRWEVEAIGQLFTRKRLLLGSQASEQKLDELIAAGDLQEYRILHLATHGQMHPTDDKQCALILARDQLPDAAAQLAAKKKIYTGRLEVAALKEWPLDADLVVLSACETGLGPYGGGDGFLGFSQALLRRGVRSVVLSLWKVDDTATALLMQRFYQNLLGKRPGLKTPLGRAAALTEAKTWLRQLTRAEAEQLAVQLSSGSWRGKVEKLQLASDDPKQPPPEPKAADRPFAHPAYWAAFILLGDPD